MVATTITTTKSRFNQMQNRLDKTFKHIKETDLTP